MKAVFNDNLAYTFAGHNIFFGSSYRKNYSSDDQVCAGVLRSFILSSIGSDVVHGSSPIDSMLSITRKQGHPVAISVYQLKLDPYIRFS